MRFFVVVCSVLGAALQATPWLMSNIEDAAFKQDIAFVPDLVTGRDGATAKGIAEAVKMRAAEHGIVLPPNGLKVEVSASRNGTYQVAGGIMGVGGTSSSLIQDVTINASYDRPVLRFFKRHVEVHVETTAPGGGPASSDPAR